MRTGRLLNRTLVAKDTAAFTFTLDGEMGFDAGQTCDITLPAPRYSDDRGNARTFSIASSPADLPTVTVATRLTGSAFKRSLMEAPLGTAVDVDGPYGSFTLHHKSTRGALPLAGGIGITPFRSIINDATERRLPHTLVLLYSNRSRENAAFLDDLAGRGTDHVTLVPVFTDETGVIGGDLVRRYASRLMDPIAYAAGPDGFVKAMRAALADAGIDPDDVRTEEFPGY